MSEGGCEQYFYTEDLRSFVKPSSKEAYKNLDVQDQVSIVEDLFKQHVLLTDFELRSCLKDRGINIPLSSVSARRNDVNKKYARLLSKTFILDNGLRKVNPSTNKSCVVWEWRK